MGKRVLFYNVVVLTLMAFVVSGCAVNLYSGRPSDKEKIGRLASEVNKLQSLRDQEKQELQEAMELLERRLQQEISDKEVKLEMAERGLVITFVAEVLFGSGKADVKENAKDVLMRVAKVIKDKVYDREIGIEGHTDNEPIKHSGWKSNWELSTARATSVLHYLVDKGGLNPRKLSAIGYGEYRPVASNASAAGKQKNRRVEIVIIPKVHKQKDVAPRSNRQPKRREKIK